MVGLREEGPLPAAKGRHPLFYLILNEKLTRPSNILGKKCRGAVERPGGGPEKVWRGYYRGDAGNKWEKQQQ